MIPISPISVKFTDEERARIKALAGTLGWTESQIIRDSVSHVLQRINDPSYTSEPKIITLGRLARCEEQRPGFLSAQAAKMNSHPPGNVLHRDF